jgi:ribosomal subunit interface protein
MQVQITGKNLDVGDALRAHITDRLAQNVGRYFDDRARGTVVLTREGSELKSDCSVQLGSGMTLQATAQAGDAYACFDAAADRLEKRLRRYKRRLKDHHNRNPAPVTSIEAVSYVIGVADEEKAEPQDLNPPIIAEDTTQIHELTVGEAVMQLDISEASFVFFKNASHGGLNVVYRRDDGNLGWVDPEGAQQK